VTAKEAAVLQTWRRAHFRDGPTSSHIEVLITEVEAASLSSNEAADRARVARGLRGFVENSVEATRITRQLRLPALQFSQFEPYAWPRSR
jgi:hypothetical protein